VVLYGAVAGSDEDRRLKLCVALKEALPPTSTSTFECFHGIYGPSLDRVLCGADIIVVDRFYSNGAIESHRIDPLLQQGKVVVSTASRDVNMQALYGDAVVFTSSLEEMVGRVRGFLGDAGACEDQKRRGREFIARKVSDAVCANLLYVCILSLSLSL
jgi:hypothetical protein